MVVTFIKYFTYEGDSFEDCERQFDEDRYSPIAMGSYDEAEIEEDDE